MLGKEYYLIWSTKKMDELAKRNNNNEHLDEFIGTKLVINDRPGNSIGSQSDRLAAFKIIYLIYVNETLLDEAEIEIFRGDRMSIQLFDKMWHIEALGDVIEVSEITDMYLGQTKADIAPTGNPLVDKWLEKIKPS